MSDFDESKHQRDEHGRFTGSGLGAWAAKKTSGKLEGFSAGKSGDLAAWTRSKLPRSSLEVKTPWEKHMVEKHLTELAFASKATERASATGDLVLSQHADQLDNFFDTHSTRSHAELNDAQNEREVLAKKVGKLRKEVETKELQKGARAAGSIAEKEWTPRREAGLVSSRKKLDDAMKAFNENNRQTQEVASRSTALHLTRGFARNLMQAMVNRFKAPQPSVSGRGMMRTEYNPIEHMGIQEAAKYSRVDLSKVHATAEVHADGSTALFITTPHKDGGEKTFAIRITPGEVKAAPAGARGVVMHTRSEPRIAIDIEHPPDAKGREHPDDYHQEKESKYDDPDFRPLDLAKKFLEPK